MIFTVCFVLLIVNNTFQENHIKVSIYYESLQEASKRALITSVMPGYEKLKDEVNFEFELNPYGRTKEEAGVLKCPQGENECLANKIQACVLAENGSLHNKMRFVNCAMKQDDPSDTHLINVCIKYWKFDIAKVKGCYEGSRANNLLSDYGTKTARIPEINNNIPAIIFNDSFDEKISAQARDHFVYVVCEKLKNAPPACASLE